MIGDVFFPVCGMKMLVADFVILLLVLGVVDRMEEVGETPSGEHNIEVVPNIPLVEVRTLLDRLGDTLVCIVDPVENDFQVAR